MYEKNLKSLHCMWYAHEVTRGTFLTSYISIPNITIKSCSTETFLNNIYCEYKKVKTFGPNNIIEGTNEYTAKKGWDVMKEGGK